MRALRIILIVTVILGGLFVIADRVAVGFAEDEAAGRLKTSEGLASTPNVSIKGFPFLTQVVGGELDEVEVGIKNYEADTSGATGGGGTDTSTGTGPGKIRIDNLTAQMRGVAFSSGYTSATAASASGTATISYAELLKAAKAEPVQVTDGVTAQVVGLSDGGNGKIKVEVEATVLGNKLPQPVSVLSSVSVKGDNVEVHADSLPNLGVQLAEDKVRLITDFEQKIDDLPGGIKLDKVEAAKTGVDIKVKGSDVELVG
ncbi:LmeA family phospholipid-binding protein [Streptomyces sp. 2A115]|uniref:LmeA family phospholipid-binding protein n=1 Tax=Streptomyces sp. 2A115 TaxID=3457439 RepID=UPI003FD13515